ncbi:MAG: tetratricopeptide repeat protein [Bacteroidetes bacterium]|nr:tetratricopeptide repeat protein [Bacteroidota bacterium]
MTVLFFSCKNDKKNNPTDTVSEIVKEKFSPEVSQLQRLLLSKPDSTGLRLKLAMLLDSIGQPKEAILQVDTLLRKDSLNYGLWFTHGQLAEDIPDTAMAIKSYQKAISIYNSPDALLSLANIYAEQKNNESLIICQRLSEMSLGREYDAHCNFITGIYYARTGNKAKALQYFNSCIANNYTYMEAYIEKGLIYFDQKDYRNALSVFQFASTVNSMDPDPYYWMGRCYELMNQKDSALLKFQQSYSLDRSDPQVKAAVVRMGGKD